MEDDLTFGTSVWGSSNLSESFPTSKPFISLPTPLRATDSDPDDSGFDDFEDFNTAPTSAIEGDDDFGDFGDFGEPTPTTSGFQEQFPSPPPLQGWHSLKLDPLPERSELEKEIQNILAPIWTGEDIVQVTTDEGIREAEGISQILITPESREMYKKLLQTPPPIKPANWTRSRIRRQHLIALGIPVNLDEMLPQGNGKSMPPLEISTRSSSTPPSTRNSLSTHISRPGTPQPPGKSSAPRFGPKPGLDMEKINSLLRLNPENLSIQPLATLQQHLADLRLQTSNISHLLTYLLQTRDALQQDSETYNGLIAGLVGEAQKMKSGKSRTASNR